MIALHRDSATRRILALLLLGAFVTGFRGDVPAGDRLHAATSVVGVVASAPDALPTAGAPAADLVIGSGPGHLTCALCAGILIGLGGGSVVGMVLLVGTQSEAIFVCALSCAHAFEII